MKQQILISLFLGSSSGLFAQELLSTAGDDYISNNISMSFSLGEPIVETFNSSNIVITQGFQQSYQESTNNVGVIDNSENSIFLFPNPVNDIVNIELENNYETSLVSLLSIDGQLIKEYRFSANVPIQIDISNYSKGVYLLQVKNDIEKIKTIKFIKQ